MAVLLIDGLNLIRRIHAGVPDTAEDRDDGVLKACVASVRRALRRHHPSHVILVMEGEELSWRSLEYPDYIPMARGRSNALASAVQFTTSSHKTRSGMPGKPSSARMCSVASETPRDSLQSCRKKQP